MKKLLGLVAGTGVIAWVQRRRLFPEPVVTVGDAPAFRTPQSEPVPVASPEAPSPLDRPSGSDEPDRDEPGGGTSDGDDLQRVSGIGPVFAGRLHAIGIMTFADLIDCNSSIAARAIDVRTEQIDDWKEQARTL